MSSYPGKTFMKNVDGRACNLYCLNGFFYFLRSKEVCIKEKAEREILNTGKREVINTQSASAIVTSRKGLQIQASNEIVKI